MSSLNSSVGSIHLILGCMFSGKTTEVIRHCRKWQSIHKKTLCINYEGDRRYGTDEKMYSHDLSTLECINVSKLSEVDLRNIADSDIILVNEGQFFSDIVEHVVKWCEELNKHIVVCGLDGDYQRRPFGNILNLIPYATTYEKLFAHCALCGDGTQAQFTWRKSGGNQQVLIGASNYTALCRFHYMQESGHEH